MVEGTGLENRHAVKRIEGSNPSFSARKRISPLWWDFLSDEVGFRFVDGFVRVAVP